ncbi:baseplate J/gp47 family protein [Marinicrinis sediminis]|uniref:Baseplate J/gp47 family protein n=1 Tax=Marinicrinis sediminis TaxID=1652465 RepID=A0ABW5R7Q1_9BACL
MSYENQTKQAILNRLLDASPTDLDKRQGSITYDLLSPAAIEMAEMYTQLDQVLQFGFADTTYGPFLDLRCQELGVYRKPAVRAVGEVTISGPEGTIIPAGTLLLTEAGTQNDSQSFMTTEEGVIVGGEVQVSAEAQKGGADGNVDANQIILVSGHLAGIVSVVNRAPFDGGANEENDQSLLNRYYDRVRKPATSGNKNQYIHWAKEVAGVSDAKVYPLWNNQPGTVKIVLLDEEKTAPPQEIVDSVSTYIEEVRPIGANVMVEGAIEVPVHIQVRLTIMQGVLQSEAIQQISEHITAYLKTLAFFDPVVRYTQIANAILNAEAVIDYTDLTVNGGVGNVFISDGEVAVLGTVVDG